MSHEGQEAEALLVSLGGGEDTYIATYIQVEIAVCLISCNEARLNRRQEPIESWAVGRAVGLESLQRASFSSQGHCETQKGLCQCLSINVMC